LEPQEGVLTFYDPTAKVVEVAGDFNGWHPEASPLAATGFGEWNIHLILRPGQYEYRFWVDGAWADDPLARHSTPNPYGGRNAVLKLGLDDRIEFL
jgi:1,4-alpha-glucan branching enzyme